LTVELLVLLVLFAVSIWPVYRLAVRQPKWFCGITMFFISIVAFKYWVYDSYTLSTVRLLNTLEPDLPHLFREKEYISSNQCRSCHQDEYESWYRTYHRTMTQIALPKNVAGSFDGSVIHSNGQSYTVYQKDGLFWASMPDPEEMMYKVQGGKPIAFEDIPTVQRPVILCTGSHHYQTYWVAGDDRYGRLQQTLPLIFLIKEKRWIPREEAFMMPPGPTRLITQWNNHCIKCHSTGGNPALQTDTKEGWFDTRVGELGIACEACHGPGENHVKRFKNPIQRYAFHLSDRDDFSIVNPEHLNHKRSSQVCGQCHGVFIHEENGMQYAKEGVLYRPGEDLHSKRHYIFFPQNESPQVQKEELEKNRNFYRERWWDDGTMLAGGREYNALAVSGCYTRGTISCLSCHSMHHSDPNDQLKKDLEGNQYCTQCHQEPLYTSELTTHTFHAQDSSGSQCMNCHMPHTTYALFSAIRNHQITSPDLSRTVQYGIPNACNLCHLDQPLSWTQTNMKSWYGHSTQPLTQEQQTISAAMLWLLKGHAAQRVITAWHVGWKPALDASGADWLAPLQSRLLNDPYGVVRYVASKNLQSLPGFEAWQYDFLADKDELNHQVQMALHQWEINKPDSLSRTGKSVLVDEQGTILELVVQKLLSERDNRPVSIKE